MMVKGLRAVCVVCFGILVGTAGAHAALVAFDRVMRAYYNAHVSAFGAH